MPRGGVRSCHQLPRRALHPCAPKHTVGARRRGFARRAAVSRSLSRIELRRLEHLVDWPYLGHVLRWCRVLSKLHVMQRCGRASCGARPLDPTSRAGPHRANLKNTGFSQDAVVPLRQAAGRLPAGMVAVPGRGAQSSLHVRNRRPCSLRRRKAKKCPNVTMSNTRVA